MTVISDNAADLAIGNIARFGDTDIFPFPIENRLLYDSPQDVKKVLFEIDADFDKAMAEMPILSSKNLSVVGYGGFRWGAQIDPVWNAYLLALTLTIASDLESNRVAETVVFSYRYKPDLTNFALFNKDVGWLQFQEQALEAAKDHEFVMRCDISDFYPRIYHHRLENALKSATKNQMAVARIMKILNAISDGASYGLPVGGPASRILSEILLNRIDRLLTLERIKFGRFVDDFVVFAKSREDGYSALIQLSSFLLNPTGNPPAMPG